MRRLPVEPEFGYSAFNPGRMGRTIGKLSPDPIFFNESELMLLAALLQAIFPYGHGRKKILRWLAKTSRKVTIAQCDIGFPLLLDRCNYIDSRILQYGGFESALIHGFLDRLNQVGASVFVDIGANIGLYSLAASRLAGIEQIVAFEPEPRNFAQFSGNLFLSELVERVDLRREALSDRAGRASFYVDREHSGVSGFTPNAKASRPITVETARLDDMFDWNGLVIGMKIDVEGAEAQVLAGMDRILRSNKVLLQIEIFPDNFSRVDAILMGLGFSPGQQISQDHDYTYRNF
jgi:FkbM family methyltransferase